MTIKRIAQGVAVGASALAAPFVAFAATTSQFQQDFNAGVGNTGFTGGSGSLATVLGKLVGTFLGLIGVIAVAYLIYGGYTWMTSQGAEPKVKAAKEIIKNAVIGIIVILLSEVIVNFVVGLLPTS